jgi:hypothetical protein
MKLVDLQLGVHRKAWSIAHLLSHFDLEEWNKETFVHSQTAPWYNGRERGLCFSCGNMNSVLNICVFEHRNSDDICALKWVSDGFGMNPPTIEKDGKKAYPTDNKWHVAKSFSYDEVYLTADWIESEFRSFLNDLVAKAKEKG